MTVLGHERLNCDVRATSALLRERLNRCAAPGAAMCQKRNSFFDDILESMVAVDANAIISSVAAWAVAREDIRAMALVGSWARGNPHQDSDIDLLLLSDRLDEYRRRRKWLTKIDFEGSGYRVLSTENASYGAVWSRHVTLIPNGNVELTFAQRSWARTDPVDVGTRQIVKDGFRVIFDKDRILATLIDAVTSG